MYVGNCNEYLVQLKLIRPSIEKIYSGIEIYLACKDDAYYLLEDSPKTLKASEYVKERYGYTRELFCDMQTHPVEELLRESNIPKLLIRTEQKKGGNLCSIYPFGASPTRSLSREQIEKVEKYVVSKNMQPVINGGLESAAWVIGVENEFTALAPTQGIKTTLIPTGIGENLYKSLYYNLDVFKI
jgi:hypothetical protein